MAFSLLIENASEVLQVTGSHQERAEDALRPLRGGVVGIEGDRIAFVGPASHLPPGSVDASTRRLDARGGFVGPGFVDPHTHLVFAGERSREFDLRNQGATYLEIAQAGGGIVSTVKATRAASEEELVSLALPRLRRLLEFGVTTAEVKSGYGLSLDSELRMLRAVRTLATLQPISLEPTLLAAHALPEEFRSDRAGYVRLCAEQIVPAVAEQKLARFCDTFVEQSAFTADEARTILGAGKKAGLIPRLHVDQLTSGGGAELAAELGAATADHLEHVTEAGIAALAKAQVTAVLVPTSTFFVRVRKYAPGRALRNAGVNVALATNVNPGSAMSENLPLAMSLGCIENGLSAAESHWAFTRGAALALKRPELGQIAAGGPADLAIFSCASYAHLPYHLGINHVRTVVKAGRVVLERDQDLPRCE